MTLCLLCDRDLPAGEERRVACTACQTRLHRHLGELPGLYRKLGDALAPSTGTGGPHVSGTRIPGLPVNEHALSLRAWGGMVDALAAHEDDWRRQLGAGMAARFRGSPEQTLTAVVGWLMGHLWWACEKYPHIDGLAEDVRRLRSAARSVVDPPERTVRVGTCPTLLDDGEPCGAVLRYLPGAATIRCAWCRSEHGPSDWVALATALEAGDAA